AARSWVCSRSEPLRRAAWAQPAVVAGRASSSTTTTRWPGPSDAAAQTRPSPVAVERGGVRTQRLGGEVRVRRAPPPHDRRPPPPPAPPPPATSINNDEGDAGLILGERRLPDGAPVDDAAGHAVPVAGGQARRGRGGGDAGGAGRARAGRPGARRREA